ncbi:hypothetical protein BH10BAC3_BH10BAC3_36260 [soil metagenome]
MKLSKCLPIVFLLMAGSACIFAQNVGIGTVTPGYRLDVMGRARVQAGIVNNANTSAGIWYTDYRTNSDIIFAGMADSVNYGLWGNRAGVGWQFFYDARYGNVGVGRKPGSGTTKLSLDDPGGASLILYSNGGYRGGMQATDSTLEFFSARSGAICAPFPCTPPPGKDIIFWPPGNCAGIGCIDLTSAGRTGFYLNEPKSRLHIAAGTGVSGVLIGSGAAVPAAGYMLSVDGKIICEELKVQLNSAWPDYVFETNYKMPSLSDLEQKVMTEKHLPGIPSASEVESGKGVEIGAVQQKLLEKVEELYRYVFEINNQNKLLRQELELLKKDKK